MDPRQNPHNMIIPHIIERKDDHMGSFDLFSRMYEDRIIFLFDQIDSNSAAVTIASLIYLNGKDSTKPIKMYINSPGGSIIDGLAIINTMRSIKAPVHTFATGLCASMGAVILACGDKGCRYALQDSEIMIHEAATGLQGKTKDIRSGFEHLVRLETKIFRILSQATGQTEEKIATESKIDKYFGADEAKTFGLIDTIISNIK